MGITYALNNFNRSKPVKGVVRHAQLELSKTYHWHLTGECIDLDTHRHHKVYTSRIVSCAYSDELDGLYLETEKSIYAIPYTHFEVPDEAVELMINTLPEEDRDTPLLLLDALMVEMAAADEGKDMDESILSLLSLENNYPVM